MYGSEFSKFVFGTQIWVWIFFYFFFMKLTLTSSQCQTSIVRKIFPRWSFSVTFCNICWIQKWTNPHLCYLVAAGELNRVIKKIFWQQQHFLLRIIRQIANRRLKSEKKVQNSEVAQYLPWMERPLVQTLLLVHYYIA